MIRLSKSSINEDDKSAVKRVLDSEFLGMGPEVEKFEKQLASYFNRKVTCVSSGTSALQLALESAGISHGDEVLVQSLTYVASFQAISATGATPIPCEVREDITIDLNDAAKKLNASTRAIMPVHYSGGVGKLEHFYEGFALGKASAVLAASIFHFGEYSIPEAKQYLDSKGIPVRI